MQTPNTVIQELLQKGIALHQQKQFDQAELIYNSLLNQNPFNEQLLFLLSDIDLRREYNGRAINLLAQLLLNNPKCAAAWCNLGIAFRKEYDHQRAEAAWTRALALEETAEVCNNLAGLYADSGDPHKALGWLARSLGIKDTVEARWQKALALLALKQWGEGWKFYESRRELETWDGRWGIAAPQWDGSPVDHLYIHGEQGVGDEIMFASCLPFVKAGRITLEVNSKVAGIMKQSYQDFTVVKEELSGKYDAKIPIGSLMKMFGFNTNPYLFPHKEKVAHYRRELEKLGPGPYIALTWLGGTKVTRCHDRSISLSDLRPIMDRYTCVSAQYEDNPAADFLRQDREAHGLVKLSDESAGGDLHDQAALFKAVDAVVTVQQTAVHVAGSVGTPTFAMIGAKPHWRYGIEGDRLPFYSSVALYRKTGEWSEVVERVHESLNRELQRATAAVA